MLISLLMDPIMSLGLSLCVIDLRQMRKALEALLAGITLALAISWVIVTLSPITDATPEIMARTQPNLFDLLVAIFSGMAGGYACKRADGERRIHAVHDQPAGNLSNRNLDGKILRF
jgi:uncharacterized membrane protein